MLNTALSILAAIALLMPGFIVAELAIVRSARPRRSDLELALRALSYTLIIHLVFGIWTVHLIESIGSPNRWPDHFGAIGLYVAVVLLGLPITVGANLNRYLASVESRDKPPNLFAAGLGGGEAGDAFDYAHRRWRREGGYVIVELVGHSKDRPRLVGGMYGRRSAVGKSPESHDIYLESLCLVSEDDFGIRNVISRVRPERGVYIPANQVARVDSVSQEPDTIKR
jgi:hypothetical protein